MFCNFFKILIFVFFTSKGNHFSTKSCNQRATESIASQESSVPNYESTNKKLRNSLVFFGCVSMGLLGYDGWVLPFSSFFPSKIYFLFMKLMKIIYFVVGLPTVIENCCSQILFLISPSGNNSDLMFIT
jgi:hypothetical protein